jgi:hypothetical protein
MEPRTVFARGRSSSIQIVCRMTPCAVNRAVTARALITRRVLLVTARNALR